MARRVVWCAAALAVLVVLGASVFYLFRPSPVLVVPPDDVLRYDFDGGLTPSAFGRDGRVPLRSSLAAGGVLTTERHGAGLAVRFPAVCAAYGDESCPRAILESGPAPDLNPGAAALRYGAAVLIAADETTKGGNVLQKGFSRGDSQYKLQVDGAAGRPTCVLVGSGDPAIHVVSSSVSVANGRWHVIECLRASDVLVISVDGRVTGRGKVPTQLSIVNSDPLRVGGKGTSANNDQFHGAIDDVFIAIGA